MDKMNKIEVIVNLFNRFFNTRVKKIVAYSTAAFCAGALITAACVGIAKKVSVQNGIGGLETSGVPDFSEDMLDAAGHGNSPSGGNDASDDDLDAASAVLSKENGGSSILTYLTYRVKNGDMIGTIADNYHVTQDTIISVNSIRQSRLLQVGQYLKIPSMPGILYTVRKNGETPQAIANEYEVSAVKCALVNGIEVSARLTAGNTLFVPDAQLDSIMRQEINGDLFIKPIRARYWLSSYYGWRISPFTGKRSFHSGVDMAAPLGTSVYAALAGKVSAIGYNSTYGNYIIVSHHSGYKTLYGHLSAILVVTGQNVDTSVRIGKVGNTGMSTGPHLHFTVFKTGKTVNPMDLWK